MHPKATSDKVFDFEFLAGKFKSKSFALEIHEWFNGYNINTLFLVKWMKKLAQKPYKVLKNLAKKGCKFWSHQ